MEANVLPFRILKINMRSSFISGVLLLFVSLSVLGQEVFTNPVRDGADPWVFEKDGEYYYCASHGGGIAVSKSKKLTNQGELVQVWKSPESGWNSANIWAPEIHHVDGRWFIYYTAGSKPGSPFIHQRSGVLRSTTDDAFGPYEDMGMLYTGDNIQDPHSVVWAIDLTPWYHKSQWYAIWSGWEENRDTDKTEQHLYIAEMSNPYTISSNRVKLTSPVEAWETGGPLDLIEGPQVVERNGKTFIIYSTRESWLKEYRLGQLSLRDGADPLRPESWEKKGPVFMGTDEVLGAGHCSFAKSPDGTEDWILYHSKKTEQPGWDRDIRLQPFNWYPDGSPNFGTPLPAGVAIPVPSGE
jgi:GH43 family beta-xylosidase